MSQQKAEPAVKQKRKRGRHKLIKAELIDLFKLHSTGLSKLEMQSRLKVRKKLLLSTFNEIFKKGHLHTISGRGRKGDPKKYSLSNIFYDDQKKVKKMLWSF